MKQCQNAEPGSYGHECGKPAKWTATRRSGYESAICDECKANGHEAKIYKNWTAYTPPTMSSPSCTHGKGGKCRICWPIQYWHTNP